MIHMARLDEMIRQSNPGDPLLYEALMVDYFNFIYRLTHSILGEPCEAEDVAQETLIKAVAHLPDYQPGTNIKSWLAKIAVNLCRDKLRLKKARKRLQDALKLFSWQTHPGDPTPEETVIRSERRQVIRSVIAGLDEKHRIPILLRYGQGMAISEIAAVLEVSEGTIHSRLHYAHQKLRGRLNGIDPCQDGLTTEDFE
jgi:RNA polymerase sigma-70 factor (ECF subfamily)